MLTFRLVPQRVEASEMASLRFTLHLREPTILPTPTPPTPKQRQLWTSRTVRDSQFNKNFSAGTTEVADDQRFG